MTDNQCMPHPRNARSLLAACLTGRIDHLAQDIDWLALADAAGRLGLSGLILEALDAAKASLPEAACLALQDNATRVASSNLHITHCFKPIAQSFDAAGIPLLLLKGAALRLTIYDRAQQRPMSDVDYMIRAEHLERAYAVLDRLGCRRGADLVRADFCPKYYNEVEYLIDHQRPVRIDLHVRPFRPLRYVQTVPDDAFWNNTVAADLDGARVLIPNPDHMLIHLAAHAAIHGADRPLWLYDIYRFAQAHHNVLDWDTVVGHAEQWGLTLPVRFALQRVEEMFGPTVPSDAMAALRRRRVGIRDRLTLWHAPRDKAHPLCHLLVDLLCTRGLRFQLGYLAAVLMPEPQHLSSIYSRRHPGWTLCAHACRLTRAVRRALRRCLPDTARQTSRGF